MENARILIVDDDESIRKTLRKALDIYDVRDVENGNQACAALEESTFDCVLLDLRLPDLDGLEILRRFELKNVIMITAHGTIENAVEAMKLGCVDYLRKPFDLSVVREQVRQVLKRRDLDEEQELKYEGLIQLAKIEVQDRHFRAAMEKVKQALLFKPDSADAYNILGVLHEILGELPLAINAYQTALNLDQDNDCARDNLDRLRDLNLDAGLKLRF